MRERKRTAFEAQVGQVNVTKARDDFSRDGCRTDADVRARRDMLRHIAEGITSGRVMYRERVWVR